MLNKNNFIKTLVIVVILVLLGGTSALAEKAIPGDLLYGVKVSINEPIAGVFATSKEDKTEWKERLVERRLEEAQKLISKNNLDENTRITLENKIKSQIDEFNTNVNELAIQKNQSARSSDINIRMQASLNAYQSVLASLATNAAPDTKNQTEQLLATISASDTNLKTSSENLAKKAGANQNTAENLLNSTELSYQKEKDKISANIQNQINEKFTSAEADLTDGKNLENSNDDENATAKFQNVIDGVNSAKLLMLSNVKKRSIENEKERSDSEDLELDD